MAENVSYDKIIVNLKIKHFSILKIIIWLFFYKTAERKMKIENQVKAKT